MANIAANTLIDTAEQQLYLIVFAVSKPLVSLYYTTILPVVVLVFHRQTYNKREIRRRRRDSHVDTYHIVLQTEDT